MNPVLEDGQRSWQPSELSAAIDEARAWLEQSCPEAHQSPPTLATLLDNGAAFVALDEAAQSMGAVHVPLPLFFTPAQIQHALQVAGVTLVVAEPALAQQRPALNWRQATIAGQSVAVTELHTPSSATAAAPASVLSSLPPHTAKITFTSGSTGAPKGVCLSLSAMQGVAQGLAQALAPLGITRHLNALPFAVLLENIAGLMAPRLLGATMLTRPLAELGLGGAARFDAARFDRAVRALQPHSLILLPQMLRAWCEHLKRSAQAAPSSLKWVAVGGAPVGAAWIERAQALGLPVGEGYGLSEGASVQTLNLPGAQRPGSVGRALPHAQVRVAADGELLIHGTLFQGYLGDSQPVPEWWPTGDLGYIDTDGFVYVQGRKKNLLITAYGRNVAPEWVETALRNQPTLAQAVVFGDGEPALSAVLWPAHEGIDDRSLQQAVDAANATLPDYARVATWARGRHAFEVSTGLATANGRPQRAAIWQTHADLLHSLTEHSR